MAPSPPSPRVFLGLCALLLVGCGARLSGAETGEGSETGEESESGEGLVCRDVPASVPLLESPDECAPYFELLEEGGTEVEVVFRNARDEPILLVERGVGCDRAPRWLLMEGSLEGYAVNWPFNSCYVDWPGCANYLPEDEAPGCLLCQSIFYPIYIEPGGRFVTTWDSFMTVETELPANCSIDGLAHSCWAASAIPAGSYPVTAVAAPLSACEGEDCSCEVDSEGSCVAPELAIWPPPFEAQAQWEAGCDLEIVFE